MKSGICVDLETLLSYRKYGDCIRYPLSASPHIGNGYSGLRGNGYDLYGIRKYQPGDSFRRVNYQATARTGDIHLNEYFEERVLSAHILLDQSSHLFFSSTGRMKSVVAAEKAAELLFCYQLKGHRVSGEVFNNKNYVNFFPTDNVGICEGWLSDVVSLNQALVTAPYECCSSSLTKALERCMDNNLSGKELYLITDFMLCEPEKCIPLLVTLSHENRIYLIQITDRLEDDPPLDVWLCGASGYVKYDRKMYQSYKKRRNDRRRQIVDISRQYGFFCSELYT